MDLLLGTRDVSQCATAVPASVMAITNSGPSYGALGQRAGGVSMPDARLRHQRLLGLIRLGQLSVTVIG